MMVTNFVSISNAALKLMVLAGVALLFNVSAATAQDNGFVVEGGSLFYQVTGTTAGDIITIFTEADGDGDVVFEHMSAGVLLQKGEVEADAIALAELIEGVPFDGFMVNSLAGADIIDLSSLVNYRAEIFAGNGDDLVFATPNDCLLYTSPSPRDQRGSRMPSSA